MSYFDLPHERGLTVSLKGDGQGGYSIEVLKVTDWESCHVYVRKIGFKPTRLNVIKGRVYSCNLVAPGTKRTASILITPHRDSGDRFAFSIVLGPKLQLIELMCDENTQGSAKLVRVEENLMSPHHEIGKE